MTTIVTTQGSKNSSGSFDLTGKVSLASVDSQSANALDLFRVKRFVKKKWVMADVKENKDRFKIKVYGDLLVQSAAVGSARVWLSESSASLDYSDCSNVTIDWIHVFGAYRNRGYGLALMYAFCHRAKKLGLTGSDYVLLIADETESKGLRDYYLRIGFKEYDDVVDKPGQQFPMFSRLDHTINQLALKLQETKGVKKEDGNYDLGTVPYKFVSTTTYETVRKFDVFSFLDYPISDQ